MEIVKNKSIKIDKDGRKDDGPEGRGERIDSNQFVNSIIKKGIEQT